MVSRNFLKNLVVKNLTAPPSPPLNTQVWLREDASAASGCARLGKGVVGVDGCRGRRHEVLLTLRNQLPHWLLEIPVTS